MLSPVILCAFTVLEVSSASPSVEEILAGTRRRAESYINVRFEYTVRATYWPGIGVCGRDPVHERTAVQATDSLTIVEPPDRASAWPDLCWIRRVPDGRGSERIDWFAWCDSQHCATYVRNDDLEKGYLYSSMGFVHPWRGPILFGHNDFQSFLFEDLNGSQSFWDPQWVNSDKAHRKWQLAGEGTWCGRKALILCAPYWEGKKDYMEVWVTGSPDYIILRRRCYFTDASEPFVKEVTALDVQDGIVYPRGGRVVSPEYKELKRWEYEFKVTSMKTLDAQDRRAWRPKWPEGTSVYDDVSGKFYRVPYAPGREQALRQQLDRVKGQRAAMKRPHRPSRGPAFYLNMALLIVFILAVVIYRYKRRRLQAALGAEP